MTIYLPLISTSKSHSILTFDLFQHSILIIFNIKFPSIEDTRKKKQNHTGTYSAFFTFRYLNCKYRVLNYSLSNGISHSFLHHKLLNPMECTSEFSLKKTHKTTNSLGLSYTMNNTCLSSVFYFLLTHKM